MRGCYDPGTHFHFPYNNHANFNSGSRNCDDDDTHKKLNKNTSSVTFLETNKKEITLFKIGLER